MLIILSQGLMMGLLGSFHCVGMCGPIALVLPVERSNKWKGFIQTFMYHLGRVITYTLMGLLFGLLGKGLYLAGFQGRISILMGAIMILAVLFPTNYLANFGFGKPLYKLVGKLKSVLGSYLQKKSSSAFITIGLLNGLLPCGLVYMALTGAVATGDAWMGAIFMALFGLGTSFLLSGVIYAGNFLSLEIRNKINKIIPYFVVLVGLVFILRGMGLGIKYISPAPQNLEISNNPKTCH
jgi:sulfite exporter TauE/SafE